MQATATFIETIDTLNFYAENPAVSKIKIPLEKLSFILQKIHTKLGGEFSKKYVKFCKQYFFIDLEWTTMWATAA